MLVKVAPDLAPHEREDVAAIAIEEAVDGLIIGNTTLSRPADLKSPHRTETGGLSGRPLMALSTEVLADLYRLTGGRIPLVGCGGVASGADAYAKIRAGASLVQLYTALVYEGPGLVRRIKDELAARLKADGFASVAEAVGVGPSR
jgi:dihydroorotate dehydrogenase